MKKNSKLALYILWTFAFAGGIVVTPDMLQSVNVWTFIPVILLFVTAVATKNYYIPFLLSSLLAFTYSSKVEAPSKYVDTLINVCSNADNVWLLLDILMIGGLIAIIQKSGIIQAISKAVINKRVSEKAELGVILLMSFLFSFDDYFFPSMMATITGDNPESSTRKDSTAFFCRGATISFANMNPVSWPIYTMGLLVANGVADSQNALRVYYSIFPYIFFPIALVAILLLRFFLLPSSQRRNTVARQHTTKEAFKYACFLLAPIILHMILTFIVGDSLKPLILTVLITAIFHAFRNRFSFLEIPQIIISGMIKMVEVCLVIIMSLVFAEAINQINFLEHATTIVSAVSYYWLIPFLAFLVFSVTEYLFSLNWSLWLILFPVFIRVSELTGSHLYLSLGAILSAGIFGSIACIYSDSSVLCVANYKLGLTEKQPRMWTT